LILRRAIRISAAAAAAVAGVGGAAVLAASSASAAQTSQQLTCGNNTVLTIRTNTNNSSDMGGWGVGQITGGGSGHLIPTSFSLSAHDDTLNVSLYSFSQPKGNGNGNANQPSVLCTQQQTITLGELMAQNGGPPPGGLPAGASPTDDVTMTIGATAIHQP
jgi:hypothetical protein